MTLTSRPRPSRPTPDTGTRRDGRAARTLDIVDQTDPADGVRYPTTILGSLAGRSARKWYAGCLISLIWIVIVAADAVSSGLDPAARAELVALLVAFALVFAVIPPINWALPHRVRLLLPLALLAFSFTLYPVLGWDLCFLWTYVGVAAAMSGLRVPTMILVAFTLAAGAAVFAMLDGSTMDATIALAAVIASISLMMSGFSRQIQTNQQLRATQHEMARLAVEQERGRVARDMHDILGHSLTVITVKAELAGRLLDTEPAKAAKEISELEDLARGALADVRSTISGYRGVSILSELANARSALEAAGIRAELPNSADVVPAARRELFGWVVREGVTNVVRHSDAASCTIRLGSSFVEMTDDGHGPRGEGSGSQGNGLAGLAERAQAAGGRLTIGRATGGGFSLRASL
jgi:two-component system sensor histidine kinase DesK